MESRPTGVFKGTEFKSFLYFCSQTTPSLCFGLIFVQCKLNPANMSWLNFGNIPPGTLLDTKPFQSV